jgi:hypothetical protein
MCATDEDPHGEPNGFWADDAPSRITSAARPSLYERFVHYFMCVAYAAEQCLPIPSAADHESTDRTGLTKEEQDPAREDAWICIRALNRAARRQDIRRKRSN